MPKVLLVAGSLSTTARASSASFTGYIETSNPNIGTLLGTIEIDSNAALAGIAAFRKAGMRIFVDQGSGTQTQIPPTDLGESLEISESLDNYADTLTFSRVGAQWSPFLLSQIRGKRPMSAKLVYGAPGSLFEATVFNGYFTASSFEGWPPVARLTCLDAAINHSEKLVSLNESPNHGKTRYQIISQVCTALGIPLGTITLGANGYVPLTKPVAVAEVKVLDFFRDFLAPCAVRIYFSNGNLNIITYDSTALSSRSLRLADLTDASLGIAVPDVALENTIVAVAVKFDSRDATGDRTLPTRSEVTFATFAVTSAVAQQDGAGVITTLSLSQPTQYQELRRIDTTDTMRGATLVRSEINEWAWFSPQVCRMQQNADGTAQHRTTGAPFYQYADGSWCVDREHKYRIVRRTVMERTVDASGNVTAILDKVYDYHWIRHAVSQITAGAEAAIAVLLSEDEEGIHELGRQVIGGLIEPLAGSFNYPTTLSSTTFDLDSDGFINQETVVNEFDSDGQKASPTTNGTYVYNRRSKRYTNRRAEQPIAGNSFPGYAGKITIEKKYTETGPDSYRAVETTTDKNAGAAAGFDGTLRKVFNGVGSRPHAETIQNESQSQEMRVTVTDDVRVSLNGSQVGYIHSEYCESENDLREAAKFAIREAAALRISVEMPLEGILHKGDWVKLTIPQLGINAESMLIQELSRSLSTFRQSMTLVWYPAEVR